jgi:UDP-N-acetylmuramyl pentapeptide phosphotransferase/UDP-N-acetylglucosamine-1-phosphate transferase
VLLAAATMGFLVLNFPSGKIFLGDAGAYTLGFLLAWMGIALISRNPDVAPISVVMIMFWPLADLSLAIYRRYRCNLPVSHPDRLHFHQIVMRGLEICVLGRGRRSVANPMATLVLLPLIATPVVVGVLMHDLPRLSFVALVVCLAAFFGIYGLGMRLATSRARSSLMSSLTAPRGRAWGRA